MNALEALLSNRVVQILIGVGLMVFLFALGESLSARAGRRRGEKSRDMEKRLRDELQRELSAVREEMKTLKATLIEHSMSLDNTYEGLKHRLEGIEQRAKQ